MVYNCYVQNRPNVGKKMLFLFFILLYNYYLLWIITSLKGIFIFGFTICIFFINIFSVSDSHFYRFFPKIRQRDTFLFWLFFWQINNQQSYSSSRVYYTSNTVEKSQKDTWWHYSYDHQCKCYITGELCSVEYFRLSLTYLQHIIHVDDCN